MTQNIYKHLLLTLLINEISIARLIYATVIHYEIQNKCVDTTIEYKQTL